MNWLTNLFGGKKDAEKEESKEPDQQDEKDLIEPDEEFEAAAENQPPPKQNARLCASC